MILHFSFLLLLATANSQLIGDGDETSNILVHFSSSMDPVYDQLDLQNFTSDSELRRELTSLQKQFTNSTQSPLQEFLSNQGIEFESFWINNKMVAQNVTPSQALAIENFPGVSGVEEEPTSSIVPLVKEPLSRVSRQNGQVTWGIQKIRADQVWRQNIDGWGIIVANIDTGVRWDHESFRDRWRRDRGWYDPYNQVSEPYDRYGHGTYITGTILGSGGIGVAPAATWIACKGYQDDGTATYQAFMKCMQWVQCPTDPNGNNEDCSKAPNVVSNSWGVGGGSNYFDEALRSWKRSGIMAAAAAGNHGNDCSNQITPAERDNIVSVGSIDGNDKISTFSSFGPSQDGRRIKPDIAAPGNNVQSASPDSPNSYAAVSGTSIACPHVAGVMALMLEKNRRLTYDDIYRILSQTADKRVDTNVKSCGGVPSNRFPNNAYGYGRIDALNAVNAVSR